MIICTHMFGGMSVTHLRKHGQYKGFFAMVMTDYTFSPFMEDIKPDVLCVSNKAMLNECREKGLPEGILLPFGIPVSPACKPCTDRAAAKEKVGLSPDTPHVLLVGGSMGAGHLPVTVAKLLPTLPSNARLYGWSAESNAGRRVSRRRSSSAEMHAFKFWDGYRHCIT